MGIDLLWLLLPVAAISGWYAASRTRARGRAMGASGSISPDYFKGINYLLNEQPDKAIDIFIKLLEVDSETVEIDGEQIPLEMEPTTSIASMLSEQNPLWRDLKAFFAGDLARTRDGLVSLEPYRPGRIPIVFVHGTFSSSTSSPSPRASTAARASG